MNYQHNSKKNCNMTILAIELSITFYCNQCAHYFDNIAATIDTLIEFVQGPCSENQHTIVESKYLEYLNEILLAKIPRKPWENKLEGANNELLSNSGSVK